MAKPFQDAIILFGDSITQEWAAGSLAHRFTTAYSRRLDVLNRGFGGYTSEWNLPIFEAVFAKKSDQHSLPAVRLVTIWLGANDCTFPTRPQHLPLAKFGQNISHYIEALLLPNSDHHQPHAYVLLLTPPPINEKMRDESKLIYPPDQRTPPDRSLENGLLYRDAVLEAAAVFKDKHAEQGKRLGVVDTWKLLIDASGGDALDHEATRPFFTDGLHLTERAYGIIFEACLNVIKQDFGSLNPDDQKMMPMTVPHWADIDPTDSWNSVLRGRATPGHPGHSEL